MNNDDDYMYPGEEWEPKIGDICEARVSMENAVWRDCEIIPDPDWDYSGGDDGYDYIVKVPGFKARKNDECVWAVDKDGLRKKRPPQQKDNKSADADWIIDFKRMIKIKELQEG